MIDEAGHPSILNSVAYCWTEAKQAVLQCRGSNHLDSFQSITKRSTASRGRLARLPLEILNKILFELDVESLGSIRLLNTWFKDVVDSLPAYRALAIYATHALRALTVTNMLSQHSVGHLYDTLTKSRCTTCSMSLGPFLFIPTGRRYCYCCIKTHPHMQMLTYTSAKKLFRLSKKALKQIAIIATVPGTYGLSRKPHKRRTRIVSVDAATQLAIMIYSRDVAESIIMDWYCTRHPDPNNTLRFMACTPFPYLDAQQHRSQKLVYCHGCEYDWYTSSEDYSPGYSPMDLFIKQGSSFTEDKFLAHYEECGSAKMLYKEYILKGRRLEESVTGRIFRT
ncbi:hypothetical protein MBM_01387 [Drepanopeziza brunnea f. sp. 'multigermtubi' MB_m1]|uniref:F-box domain-containing protein n=1 Tax=Marssonina brunnea f. sp. multigermtubi (strain MB_m1) TaxID=1072389 RepID=K1WSV5_MARBU|nr:uncharacterized protein MBM_01387 [Drepanopeziza brunnea f. sp. 'multigermtubi' MB_m1]EKD20705.1 hypothetical protein MBM_01387 [Drepanopeziza brunnea f. sp. 'multigermtubi' MB_m1]